MSSESRTDHSRSALYGKRSASVVLIGYFAYAGFRLLLDVVGR